MSLSEEEQVRAVPGSQRVPTGLGLAMCVFLPFAVGYFLSYLFRVVNAVIAGDLIADLSLSAGALGLLTSTYFLAFAAFQLPLGVLLDRFGPRRVVGSLMLVAAAGSLIFGIGSGLPGLTVGRALVGLGVSGCLMGSFKAFVQWYPPLRLPLVNGCLLGFGGLGAMVATSPVEYALGWMDWRTLFVGLAVACAASSALIWTVVPERRQVSRPEPLGRQIAGVRSVFANGFFWRVAPLGTVVMGSSMAIQGLWAGPWLRDVAGLDRSATAAGLLLIALALTLGFPTWGIVATQLARRGVDASRVVAVAVAILLVLMLLLTLQVTSGVLIIWMAFTFAGSSGTLLYAVLTQRFSVELAGRVNAALNLMVFVGAFGIQWALGVVIQFWESAAPGGYDATGYMAAFASLGLLQLAAYIWYLGGVLPRRA